MPKPACVKCGTELSICRIGARVVFTAYDPPKPHKVYNGDLWSCPDCNMSVVTGYGGEPVWQNGDPEENLEIGEEDIIVGERNGR